MERMKVEIDSEELKRLKSREEKYLAYMDMLSYRGEDKTYVDALCGKVAELEEENNVLRENVNHRAGRCADLSEENERLKDNVEFLHSCLDDRDKSIAIMEEENKKLKDDIKKWEDRWMVKLAEIYVMPTRELTTAIAKNEWFSSWYDTVKKKMLHELGFDRLDVQDLIKENKKLKERISELEDVSKDYDVLSKDFITATGEIEFRKDEVERFRQNAMQDMKEITDLEKENKKLKSDLSECECSMHFENDEVGFWKREYKRLKKWIKDHCKGYGNLFPEDEMKRQWKKADKKRKKSDLYKDVGLMEEDTLQELKDIGELGDDELIYEEGLYD